MTKLGHYPIVLGIPWLKRHDPAIRFFSNQMTFDSRFCLENCQDLPTTIYRVSSAIPENLELLNRDIEPTLRTPPVVINASAFLSLANNRNHRHDPEKLETFALSLYDIQQTLKP